MIHHEHARQAQPPLSGASRGDTTEDFGLENDDQLVMMAMEQVRRFLDERPNARDTLDGIAQFWIAKGPLEIERETVLAALDELVAQGYLARISLAAGTTLYGRAGT